MILRTLTPADRAQAEALWHEIFAEDTRAFNTYYFDNRFYPAHSFGAFDGDRLAAMALGRPTEIAAEGRILPALLVAGVSTRPPYRGQGLMHRLMTLLIDHARSGGFACCYLHPVSETLYASLGFRNGTDALVIRSDAARAHGAFELKEGTDISDLLAVYGAVLGTHDGMQLRDVHEMQLVLADYAADGAETLIACADGRPVGYICFAEDGLVSELTALSADAYAFLLDEAAKRTGRELTAIVPTDCGLTGERRYSMQYLVFGDAFKLPLQNGFCRLAY